MNGSKRRASDERRCKLREADGDHFPTTLSNLRDIESYYGIADKVLLAFDECYATRRLDDAYIYGRRFAKFSMEALPTHDYYKSPKAQHVRLRKKNVEDMEAVMKKLEDVALQMDQEEEQLLAKQTKQDVELSAMQKLEQLRAPTNKLSPSLARPSSLGPPPLPIADFKYLPPPILPPAEPPAPYDECPPPPPPPAYSDVVDDSQYQQKPSLYMNNTGDSALPTLHNLSFHHKPSSVSSFVPSTPEVQKPTTPKQPIIQQQKQQQLIPIRKQQIIYADKFDQLTKSKQIEIFPLSTYQGRLTTPGRDSTNGCTVISPLVAAYHLESHGIGIADCTIEEIIDTKAPPILSAVRSKLGLRGDALIVPSDVHDYLVDRKILYQERFVGVCGGNILDDDHVGELLNMLQSGKCIVTNNNNNENGGGGGGGGGIPTTTRKVAAALFFHEHVVSILKLTAQQQTWYDIVDSMPARHMFNGRGCSSRTRCKGRHSLEVFLKKYAVSKFSEGNCAYIDRNRWDDAMCDFDPRVFQAFVWAK